MRAKVITTGGSVTRRGAELSVEGADSALILVDVATSFRRFDDVGGDPEADVIRRLGEIEAIGFDALRAAHVAEHQRLFHRLAIDLGSNGAAALADSTSASPPTPAIRIRPLPASISSTAAT